jgi:hypothetical protein
MHQGHVHNQRNMLKATLTPFTATQLPSHVHKQCWPYTTHGLSVDGKGTFPTMQPTTPEHHQTANSSHNSPPVALGRCLALLFERNLLNRHIVHCHRRTTQVDTEQWLLLLLLDAAAVIAAAAAAVREQL